MESLRILDVNGPSITNGIGCRIVVWVAGCPFKCKGCHNEWTWDYEQGSPMWMHLDDIANKVDHDYIDGITVSGGDPLAQPIERLRDLNAFLIWFKEKFPSKTVWVYTGYTVEKFFGGDLRDDIKELAENIDVVIDGQFDITKKSITNCQFRGSTNQRIIDLKKYMQCKDVSQCLISFE